MGQNKLQKDNTCTELTMYFISTKKGYLKFEDHCVRDYKSIKSLKYVKSTKKLKF